MLINQELYKVATPSTKYPFRVNLFMWPNRTLFFGPLNHLGLHCLGSINIKIGLYQPFLMRTRNGSFKSYRCVIIPAGYEHEVFAFGSPIASLTVERNSSYFTKISYQASSQSCYLKNIEDQQWVDTFQRIYEEKISKEEINRLITQLLNFNNKSNDHIDPRISNIINTIREDSEYDYSQEQLAASEGLSSSRFRHIFREQFNVPFRHYKVWRKVITALNSLYSVDNLTHAAMEAGFTDSAHLNRCFRNILGKNPSHIFRNMDRFEI